MEAVIERCARCGQNLAQRGAACPTCGAVTEQTQRPTRGVFILLIILLIAAFTLTGFIVRGFDLRQRQLAQRWFSRGDHDLSRGAAAQAVDDFQTALAYAQGNDAYRLKLALALMQDGREEEARAHLTNLWETRPGDANVNLQLARVMARLGHSQDAIRYYHGAIYGVWDSDPLAKRQAARFELSQYLLATRQKSAAESELIALSSEMPADAGDRVRLGDLLMETGDPQRALAAYRHARGEDKSGRAELGAARASLVLHHLREARDYARDALRIDPKLQEASVLEANADALLRADPFASGLSPTLRAQRAMAAFNTAANRLQNCDATQSDTTLQQLMSSKETQFKRLRVNNLRSDPDLLQQAVAWSYEVERATEGVCGAPTGLDATFLMLARFPGAS